MKITNIVVATVLALSFSRLSGQEKPAAETKDAGAANSDSEPKNADEAYRRAAQLVQAKRMDAAISMYGKAIFLKPDWAEAYAARGWVQYQIKHYTEAIMDFNQAIQLDAGHALWYNRRGLAYSYSGRHPLAIENYNRAMELEPDRSAYYNNRGWAYRELGQFDKAISDLSRAIQLQPDYVLAFENRATAYGRMKDWPHAIEDLTAAIQIAPSASLLRRRADAKLAAGDQAGADEDRNEAAALSPATAALPPGTYKIGSGVSTPQLLSKVEPKYSEEARQARVQGTVVLSVVVTAEGKPTELKVVRSLGSGLDEKAIEAVSQWKFRPGMKDGKAVAVQAAIEVNFQLLADRIR